MAERVQKDNQTQACAVGVAYRTDDRVILRTGQGVGLLGDSGQDRLGCMSAEAARTAETSTNRRCETSWMPLTERLSEVY